ncbi:thiamine-phosphate kinase [Bowdeniella massiliensis]|uniref:thiamine-phosphate kinase n=1 Tax=Bowdeniella massiliensis TaxID=2932264 RepID=UPI0020279C34
MADQKPSLADLGEDELLSRIIPLMPAGETVIDNGDDAAVLPARDGRIVACTDVIVEDRHFRREWSTGSDVGWRVAMQNLSDVSAMGAIGTQLLIGLVLPAQTPVAWIEDFARGVAQACEHAASQWMKPVGVAGGDLSGGEMIMASITALGDLEGREPLTRDGAREGDIVAVAGTLGYSAAGLALRRAGITPDRLSDQWQNLADAKVQAAELAEYAWHIYRRPQPPLAAGRRAGLAGASAAMDISDGLLRDLGRLARASDVGIVLDSLPDLSNLELIAALLGDDENAASQAATWWLTGGEDHALVATFPPHLDLPQGFSRIGQVTGEGGEVTTPDHLGAGAPGWDHFS